MNSDLKLSFDYKERLIHYTNLLVIHQHKLHFINYLLIFHVHFLYYLTNFLYILNHQNIDTHQYRLKFNDFSLVNLTIIINLNTFVKTD